MLFRDPGGQFVRRSAFFQFQAMRFQHIAQMPAAPLRASACGRSGCAAAFALDEVAAALAADVDQIRLLELLDEIGEAARAVRALAEGRIQLQHGGLQQAELRLHRAAFQHLQRAFHQRHGLLQRERSRTVRCSLAGFLSAIPAARAAASGARALPWEAAMPPGRSDAAGTGSPISSDS